MKIITSIKLLVLWLLIGFYSQAQTYSDWSNVVQATTCPSAENLSVSISSTNVTFSWDAIGEADSYTLYYKSVNAANWTEVTEIETTSHQVVSSNFIGDYNWKLEVVKEGCESEEVEGGLFNVCVFSWTELVNVNIESEGRLRKTGGSNTIWSAGAISDKKIFAGENGFVKTIISPSDDFTNNKFVIFGLSVYNTSPELINFDAAFFLRGNELYIHEKGSNKGLFGTFQAGDELSISREGTLIIYRRNNQQLRQIIADASKDLYLDISLYGNNSLSPELEGSFCNPLSAIFEVVAFDDCTTVEGEGILKVIPRNGSGDYSFNWLVESENNTEDQLGGLNSGYYEVNITDNVTGLSFLAEGFLNASSPSDAWEGLFNMSVQNDGSLLSTQLNESWGTSSAYNSDKFVDTNPPIIFSEEIEISTTYKVNDLGKIYAFGLANPNVNNSLLDLRYGILLNKSVINPYENAKKFSSIGTAVVGDVIKILVSFQEMKVKYFVNDVVKRVVPLDLNKIFHLDVASYTPGSNIKLETSGFSTDCGSGPNTRESLASEETSLNDLNSELRAYPNPTNGELTLSYNVGEEGAKVEVYNLMGQRVLESAWEAGNNIKQVDLGQQAKGMYIVKVVTSKETITEKVIVR